MLRDTDTALEPAARAAKPAAQITASAVAMPAAIFTATSAPPASMIDFKHSTEARAPPAPPHP